MRSSKNTSVKKTNAKFTEESKRYWDQHPIGAEIIDAEARRALIDEMRRYDRIGRRFWKEWAGASVELERSPVGIGEFEAVNTVAATANRA